MFRHLDSHVVPKHTIPSSRNKRWKPLKSPRETHGYTVEPIRLPSTGGRGPNGRIWNFRRAGGLKQYLRMVDWNRGGPTEGKPLEEKVLEVIPDRRMRSADLALVAAGEKKRYIVATQNMKAGDVIRSSQVLTSLAGVLPR
jgi:large subunit ribosomal protein L2